MKEWPQGQAPPAPGRRTRGGHQPFWLSGRVSATARSDTETASVPGRMPRPAAVIPARSLCDRDGSRHTQRHAIL